MSHFSKKCPFKFADLYLGSEKLSVSGAHLAALVTTPSNCRVMKSENLIQLLDEKTNLSLRLIKALEAYLRHEIY